jgi:hypothetical protein
LNQTARLVYGMSENVSWAIFRLPAGRACAVAKSGSDALANQPVSVISI